MRTSQPSENDHANAALADWLKLVQESVHSLQFGVVQIVVHNGKVVQIDKTEKLRIEQTTQR